MSNKRTIPGELTVAFQKKNVGKYVPSVTDYDIPFMERPAIKEILTIKEAVNHFLSRMRILIWLNAMYKDCINVLRC